MDSLRSRPRPLHAVAALLFCGALSAPPARAQAQAQPAYETTPCFTPSDPQGRGQFPPHCDHGFASHETAVLLETGLPAGVAIGGRARLVKMSVTAASDGGALGGRTVQFTGTLKLELRGLGGLPRVNSKVLIPVTGTFVTAPQDPAASVQEFDFELVSASGALAQVDKDFATLAFQAGAAFGLPCTGRATCMRQPGGEWATEAWLDLRYSLAFSSVPGGELTGLSGTTIGQLHLLAGRAGEVPERLPESGAGSIAWPPATADGPRGLTPGWFASQRLAPARALLVRMNLRSQSGAGVYSGSALGGELSVSDDLLELEIVGEGAWGGYRRTLTVPVQTFINWGPRADHLPRQGRAADVHLLYGEIAGDPDFAMLRVMGGSGFGMQSPGHALVEKQASGDWSLGQSTDLGYRIEWTGAANGMFAGQSGNTQAVLRLRSGSEQEGVCEAPDDGSGSVEFPPPCVDGFVGEPAVLAALNGLPSGAPLLARLQLKDLAVTGRTPGGALEGQTQSLTATLVLSLQGTGALGDYARTLELPATAQTMTAPWVKSAGPQHFETMLQSLTATLPPDDPDFTSLSLVAGEGFGLLSRGHTSHYPALAGSWKVDAWLDVGFMLSFTGRAGGPFAGLGGSTFSRARLTAGAAPAVLAAPEPRPAPAAGGVSVSAAMPNPARGPVLVTLGLPRSARVRAAVHDVLGRVVRVLEDGERGPGVQSVAWDGRDQSGRTSSPGIYLVRLDIAGKSFARTVVVAH